MLRICGCALACCLALMGSISAAHAERSWLLGPPLASQENESRELLRFLSDEAPQSVPLTEDLAPMTHAPRWTACCRPWAAARATR